MRGERVNAQRGLGAQAKTAQGIGLGKGGVDRAAGTYSLKLIVHKLALEPEVLKELGTRNTIEFGFGVKLLEYPTVQISDKVKATKDQLGNNQGQPKFVEIGIGKSWVFAADKANLLSQIEKGNVTVSVITTSGKELGVAKLALQSFKKNLQEPQSEASYRRKTFSLFRAGSENHTGQLEISLSFTCASEERSEGVRASRLLLANQPKGFFDESNGSSQLGVAVPQIKQQLTASMLSRNDFAEELVAATVEKSAVEAILESKRSKNFFDESEDKSKGIPLRPTIKQTPKKTAQSHQLQLAASVSASSTLKLKESKPKSQVNISSKPVVPVEAARVELREGAPSVLRPFATQVDTTLENQLKELSRMPGIHEMATQSMYCPPPLFYQKSTSLTQGYIETETNPESFKFGERQTLQTVRRSDTPPLQQNYMTKGEPQTEQQAFRPTIVLNERATRSLLSETDIQMAIGQNTLLDLVLAEIVRLKSQSLASQPAPQNQAAGTAAIPSPLVRVLLENPQALLGGLHRSGSGSEYHISGTGQHLPAGSTSPKQNGTKKGLQPIPIKNNGVQNSNNESLKDSIFQQSVGKKGDKRRGLEKIEEHGDSKYYDEEFDSIRDDVQMSLSISQPAPQTQTAKPTNFLAQHRNNNSPLLKKESGPGDFESQSVIIDPLRASESAGALNSRRKESSNLFTKEQDNGPSIQCINCKRTIFVKNINEHFAICLKPELQSKMDQVKRENRGAKEVTKLATQNLKKSGYSSKNGGQASPNMKASASQDPYAGSFADADQMGISASKSSMLRKSDKDMIQRSESRVKTDYDDEFIDPGTERSELPDF